MGARRDRPRTACRLVPAVARELADARSRRERQRAELALKESQAQLRGIIDSAMDAIITIDEDHCIVLFNPAAEAMFGCPAHEAIGELVERFIPLRSRWSDQIFEIFGIDKTQFGDSFEAILHYER